MRCTVLRAGSWGTALAVQLARNGNDTVIWDRNPERCAVMNEEHRNQKLPGISYEDDYRGNALAAIISPKSIEVRYHRSFSDDLVKTIVTALLREPKPRQLSDRTVSYQGRPILT